MMRSITLALVLAIAVYSDTIPKAVAEDDVVVDAEMTDDDEEASWKGLVEEFEKDIAATEEVNKGKKDSEGWLKAPDNVMKFMQWVESEGMDTGLILGMDKRGITPVTLAKTDLKENARFLNIPDSLMITKYDVDQSPVGKAITEAGFSVGLETYLTVYVMVEMKSPDSRWKPWFSVINGFDTPYFWPESVLREAQGTLARSINKDLKSLRSIYQRLFPKLADLHPKVFAGKHGFSDFMWANSFVRSRLREIPILTDARSQNVRYDSGLVPLVDFMRHDPSRDYGIVPIGVAGPSLGFVYFGDKAKEREEVFFNKAKDKTTVEWILYYGQVPQGPNPSDHVVLVAPKMSAAAKGRLKEHGIGRSFKLKSSEDFPTAAIKAFQIAIGNDEHPLGPRLTALKSIRKVLSTKLAQFPNSLDEDKEILAAMQEAFRTGIMVDRSSGAGKLMTQDASPAYLMVVDHRVREQSILTWAREYIKGQIALENGAKGGNAKAGTLDEDEKEEL
eukprot:TRINITY_DN6187_c1_g1_i1.p1 TRINITY_DN6187_c1_g1~~TRINITY_DN6187_c1_g1_i1.p1  ORF type:complete len:504 (+),score=150.18 TRINITY_DN6187_c1_g1_i1:185-1696(+)